MGRTYRRRKKNASQTICGHSLENDDEIIRLNKWIKSEGFTKNKKIHLYHFISTGRGIMALEKVAARDILMEVPFNLILSFMSLESDSFFKSIFTHHNLFCKNGTFKCQEFLAFFIALIKINLCDVYWKNYVNTLPEKIDVPYFCPDSELLSLDESIQCIVQNQRDSINNSYNIFHTLLLHTLAVDDQLLSVKSKFTLELYSWAYFAVNSRCVYLDPNIIKELLERSCNENHYFSLKNLLADQPCLGLIPYLDMFNHSADVATSATLTNVHSLLINNKPFDLPIFRLISLSSCPKYHQVFINYGNHCNLKLLTEYGFCLPNNKLNQINFQFNNICNIENNIKLSKKQYQIILKQSIDKNLTLDLNGLSYNFLRLLFICISQNDKEICNIKLFSSNYSEEEMYRMVQFAYPILIKRLNTCFKALNIENNPIIYLCKVLMKDYIHIIELFLDNNYFHKT